MPARRPRHTACSVPAAMNLLSLLPVLLWGLVPAALATGLFLATLGLDRLGATE